MSQPNETTRRFVGILKSYSIWFWGVFAIAFLHRVIAIYYFGKNTFSPIYATGGMRNALNMWVEFFGESTVLGFAYDIIFASLAAIPLAFVPRWLGYVALLGISMVFAANLDHIKFNHENINFSTAGIGADLTFIRGMLNAELAIFSAMFFVSGAAVVLAQRARPLRLALHGGSAALIALALLVPLNGSFANPLWLQSNPFLGSPFRASTINEDHEFRSDALLPRSVEAKAPPQYNVLLVYLEGLSQHSLQVGEMEFLSSVADRNIQFTRYVGHQLITANGLYASLTGDLPYFAKRRSRLKWATAPSDSEIMRGALPNLLKDHGYRTVFLQSALLSFMSKDEIMPNFGFDTLLGRNDWETFYSEDGWGIDDRALFEHAVEFIDTLPRDERFFIGVLTTGTHALYNVPPDFLPDGESDRYRSLRYLDEAIERLLSDLEERRLLENTIVIFTADESRERSTEIGQFQNQMALNWLPLIVVHPSGLQKVVEEYVSATQLPNLIMNLQAEEVDPFLSELRAESRPVVFGNVFSKRVFWFDPERRSLLACMTSNFVCAEYSDVNDPFTMSDRSPGSIQAYPGLQALITDADEAR